jgi:hypothetical protein
MAGGRRLNEVYVYLVETIGREGRSKKYGTGGNPLPVLLVPSDDQKRFRHVVYGEVERGL